MQSIKDGTHAVYGAVRSAADGVLPSQQDVSNGLRSSVKAVGHAGSVSVKAVGSAGQAGVKAVGSAGQASVKAVGSAGQASVKAVGSAGQASVKAVGSAGQASVKAVGNVGQASVKAVGNVGQASVKAVGSVGQAGVKAVGTAGKVVVLDPLKVATKFAIVDPMKRMSFIGPGHRLEDLSDDDTEEEEELGDHDSSAGGSEKRSKKKKKKHPQRESRTPPPRPVWSDVSKSAALGRIQLETADLQTKIGERRTLQAHNETFVAARLDANNRIGAVLSMKQVLKFQANIRAARTAIEKLEALSQRVEGDEVQFEYEQEMAQILAAPPLPVLTDSDEIYEEARKLIQAHQAESEGPIMRDGLFEA